MEQPKAQRGFLESATGTAMCALTLVYHEEVEAAILAVLRQQLMVVRYTKVRDVVGARDEALERADVAPRGSRHMLVVLAERETVDRLLADFRALRQKLGHGLRGYVTPVEELI